MAAHSLSILDLPLLDHANIGVSLRNTVADMHTSSMFCIALMKHVMGGSSVHSLGASLSLWSVVGIDYESV